MFMLSNKSFCSKTKRVLNKGYNYYYMLLKHNNIRDLYIIFRVYKIRGSEICVSPRDFKNVDYVLKISYFN